MCLAVHNDGTPIPDSVMRRVFDPLTRGESPKAEGPTGSLGLGLYITREIVTAHGGAIDVKSAPETGTTFTIRLPRRPQLK